MQEKYIDCAQHAMEYRDFTLTCKGIYRFQQHAREPIDAAKHAMENIDFAQHAREHNNFAQHAMYRFFCTTCKGINCTV